MSNDETLVDIVNKSWKKDRVIPEEPGADRLREVYDCLHGSGKQDSEKMRTLHDMCR